MTLKEFKKEVINFAEHSKPKQWRKGQAVFNYIDKYYRVARNIQFEDGVDCFYNDDVIDEFIEKAFYKLVSKEN